MRCLARTQCDGSPLHIVAWITQLFLFESLGRGRCFSSPTTFYHYTSRSSPPRCSESNRYHYSVPQRCSQQALPSVPVPTRLCICFAHTLPDLAESIFPGDSLLLTRQICAMIWDIIVVGGGLAGSVISSRLIEQGPSRIILLVEAGPNANDDAAISCCWSNVSSTYNTALDWNDTSVPQVHLNNLSIALDQGRGLGGGTQINGGESGSVVSEDASTSHAVGRRTSANPQELRYPRPIRSNRRWHRPPRPSRPDHIMESQRSLSRLGS